MNTTIKAILISTAATVLGYLIVEKLKQRENQ